MPASQHRRLQPHCSLAIALCFAILSLTAVVTLTQAHEVADARSTERNRASNQPAHHSADLRFDPDKPTLIPLNANNPLTSFRISGVLHITSNPANQTPDNNPEHKPNLAPAEGFGLLILDGDFHNNLPATPDGLLPDNLAAIDFVSPNLARSIGIGFDTSNPPTDDPFDANGNIHQRPEREISLHIDGRERIKRLVAEPWLDRPIKLDIEITYVIGGAEISVKLDDTSIFDRTFLPGVLPMKPGAILAGAGTNSIASINAMRFEPGPASVTPMPEPVSIWVFDRQRVSSATDREPKSIVDFSSVPQQVARVIATLRLDAPAGGIDPWDRRGALYLFDDQRQRFEVVRFMTPFAVEAEWQTDVTHLLPLFKDQKSLSVFIDTWRGGFLASVRLDFYPGSPKRKPIEVRNLWQGEPVIGDANQPVTDFFDSKFILVPDAARSLDIRITATGHGQAPNAQNAAEFMPIRRTLTVNSAQFESTLWKTDVYLNPIRPQKGTWKYDRAGWAPGSIVEPWVIDASQTLNSSRELTLDYTLEPYENPTPDPANPPVHWIDAQVIFYE